MTDELIIDINTETHILTATFNRPHKYNALRPEDYYKLAEALYELQHNKDLRVGVIRANGDHFTSGLELDKWTQIFASGKPPEIKAGQIDPYGLHGEQLTKPIVMAVQGLCYTSGLEMLLNTDIRVASPGGKFAQLEVKRGIYPCGGGTVRLPSEIGWARGQRYLMTGDSFSSEQAYEWGMISELVDRDQLHETAHNIALSIAKAAPLGVTASLKSSKLARQLGHQAAIAEVFDDMPGVLQSQDAREGVQSFLERREAVFQGE